MLAAAVTICIFFLLPVPLSAQQERPDREELAQWRVLLHCHAALEEGWDALVNLQTAAHRSGLHAVITTDQLVMEWEWGPPLIRALWNYRYRGYSKQSIMRFGVEDYFARIDEIDRMVPEITLIAGSEVAPYYYWTGMPWNGNLTMGNWQRNILVLGVPDPSSYMNLPVLGLRRSLLQSWKDVLWLAALLTFAFVFLWMLNRLYFVRASLVLIPVVLLIWSGPPAPGPFSQYSPDAGIAPYQVLIDSVNGLGGFTIWTQVETRDDRREHGVNIYTSSHPQVLLESKDYQGFGSIYPSISRSHEPGREWDAALAEYLRGERSSPPFGWGELALHYPGQVEDKGVSSVLSVLLAPDRSRESLLDALRNGRGYALRSTRFDRYLRLDMFEATDGSSSAGMGQSLSAEGQVTVRANWDFVGDEPPVLTARLIRSGEVVVTKSGIPPMELSYTEPVGQSGRGQAYYRLQLEGRTHRVLANPIFIQYAGAGDIDGGGG